MCAHACACVRMSVCACFICMVYTSNSHLFLCVYVENVRVRKCAHVHVYVTDMFNYMFTDVFNYIFNRTHSL